VRARLRRHEEVGAASGSGLSCTAGITRMRLELETVLVQRGIRDVRLAVGVRIDHDDDTFVVGRLVKIRHRRFGDAGAHDIDTRVVIEVLGDQRVAKRFDAIGVVELL